MTAAAPVAFAGPFRLRDMGYESGETHARHAHGEVQISFLLRGAMREESNGVDYRGRTGDIVVKPAGMVHSDVFEPTRIVCIDVQPQCLDLPFDRYAWHRTAGATAAALRMTRCFFAGEDASDDLDDLLAMLPSRVAADRVLATRAARAIEETFPHPASVSELAADLRVHRVYLARVFRLQWGCSPREYVQQLRVRAAAHDLASTTRALAGIALDSGFSDQSHMNRAFLRRMGVTPAAFRRIART
jgi:AraC family transcriptional regulator